LVIEKATATINLGDLTRTYNGGPKVVNPTTVPAGLKVIVTYNGSLNAPSLPGSYAVVGTVSDVNYTGSKTGTLKISLFIEKPTEPLEEGIKGYNGGRSTVGDLGGLEIVLGADGLAVKASLGLGVRAVLLQSTDLVNWVEVRELTGQGAEKRVSVPVAMPSQGERSLFLKLQLRESEETQE